MPLGPWHSTSDDTGYYTFTYDQMREYARAAIRALSADRGEAVDGRFPAPIRNPEAWPPNYANGYNDALRLATEEGFARPRASAAPSGVSDAVRDAIQHIRDQYPYDLFPLAGESLACKGARMARLTCDNIELEFKRLMEERQPQPGRVVGLHAD
jgi:hypothetical protein